MDLLGCRNSSAREASAWWRLDGVADAIARCAGERQEPKRWQRKRAKSASRQGGACTETARVKERKKLREQVD